MNQINKINGGIYPVGKGIERKPKAASEKGNSFKEALDIAADQLKVTLSKHAQVRMESRNIKLDSNQMERLNLAVQRAKEKGIMDTLVLMDDKAFVINVRNKTVITAADRDTLKEKVFTNIDGAVII